MAFDDRSKVNSVITKCSSRRLRIYNYNLSLSLLYPYGWYLWTRYGWGDNPLPFARLTTVAAIAIIALHLWYTSHSSNSGNQIVPIWQVLYAIKDFMLPILQSDSADRPFKITDNSGNCQLQYVCKVEFYHMSETYYPKVCNDVSSTLFLQNMQQTGLIIRHLESRKTGNFCLNYFLKGMNENVTLTNCFQSEPQISLPKTKPLRILMFSLPTYWDSILLCYARVVFRKWESFKRQLLPTYSTSSKCSVQEWSSIFWPKMILNHRLCYKAHNYKQAVLHGLCKTACLYSPPI